MNAIGLFGVGNANVELDDLVYNQQAVQTIPEPATLAGLGLVGAILARRRRIG